MHIELKIVLGIEADVDNADATNIMVAVRKWIKSLDIQHPSCATTLYGSLQVDPQEFVAN